MAMILGLTGGIGCGKSAVGALLEQMGVSYCSADVIVADLLTGDVDVIAAIKMRFGKDLVTEAGVQRQRLGEIVFSDAEALYWLEELLHPRVERAWKAMVAASPNCNWCIEIPLLFEKNLEKNFDCVVCVVCELSQRLSRLRNRGLCERQALARNALQMPLLKKVELADIVILNDGSESFLEAQIAYLTNHFLSNSL